MTEKSPHSSAAATSKTKAKILVFEGTLTPQSLLDALTALEPSWSSPSLERVTALVGDVGLLDGFVKRREGRARAASPIRAALKLLRETAEKRYSAIDTGRHSYIEPVRSNAGVWLHVPDLAKKATTLNKVRILSEWFGEETDEILAEMLGEIPLRKPSQSWHDKARRWVPMLAAIWHPLNGTHPLHEKSSIVRVLHGLLLATGEISGPAGCTPGAVCKFVRDNKHLLKVS
jgi:hypothetical protein